MDVISSIKNLFQAIKIKLEGNPDENECLKILQDIENLASSLGSEDYNLAVSLDIGFYEISEKLNFLSPDFHAFQKRINGLIGPVSNHAESNKPSSFTDNLKLMLQEYYKDSE